MRKYLLLLLIVFCTFQSGFSQDTLSHQKIYYVVPKYELTGAGVLTVASYFGFRQLDKVANFTAADIAKLNPNDINSFDRPVAFKDPAGFDLAQKNSDFFLNLALVSPALLMIDKNMRKDWVDLLSMYMVTHAVDNAVYFASAFPVRRARPLTYNPKLSVEEKTGDAKSNSFFSGHVSFSSTATFFLAKVLTDYKQIKGWKRIAIFSVAAVPPALVGYYRMEAGKHFKTDVILGFLVGAASGILVPEFHKKLKENKKISLQPFYSPSQSGVALNIKI
ncbi:phosphatase PAP2 family protein [Flectobacillus major]|uniref:phosphatase PAP2 family protein n=1 Tax=Flectobacillus major TaxID=103 RepID=UPI000402F4D6|nr:phosphatase PAP2 family protein [Flectobacillus major]